MMANDFTALIDKIEGDLHLIVLDGHLPEKATKPYWEKRIREKTIPTFSRYFSHKVPFTVSKDTCNMRREHGKMVYYIKDEIFANTKIVGVEDLDWTDTSEDNIGVGQTVGYGTYRPHYSRMGETLNMYTGYQLQQDNMSLFNNNIYLDFEYPNKIILSRVGNTEIVLSSFVVNLLVEHGNLATISPTKMETFEELAEADVAEYLYGILKYYDGLETFYININLLLDELKNKADTRRDIIDRLENSYVSTANDNIPYIMTVNG